MTSKSITSLISALCCLMTLTSCVKDSEYTDSEIANVSPNITSELVFTSFDDSFFLQKEIQNERVTVSDTIFLERIDYKLLSNYLTSTDLQIKIKNSLNWDFSIDLEFLDEIDDLIYALNIPVAAGTSNKPKIVETYVNIEEPELKAFKNSTKVVIHKSVLTDKNQPLLDTDGQLEMNAVAIYTFN